MQKMSPKRKPDITVFIKKLGFLYKGNVDDFLNKIEWLLPYGLNGMTILIYIRKKSLQEDFMVSKFGWEGETTRINITCANHNVLREEIIGWWDKINPNDALQESKGQYRVMVDRSTRVRYFKKIRNI